MSTPKRPGSSPCIEFFISLLVGVLAVVGGLFIIGFLLVDPMRHAPGHRTPTVGQDGLSDGCEPVLHTKLLPNGCTLNGVPSIQEGVCSNRECTCDDQDTKVCCCRANEHQQVDNLVCPDQILTPTITNTTRCGCGSCDDITIQVHIMVVDRDSDEPIAAALVLHNKAGEEPRFAGLTSNHGLLIITEVAGNMYIELKIIASGYIPYMTIPMRLHPHLKVVTLHVPLIPSMSVELGLGGSEVILRLGSMASVTAPAGSFHRKDGDKDGDEDDVYEELIRFTGMFVTPSDTSGLTGVPGTTFNVVDKVTGAEETMGVLFVTWLEFMSEDGTPLTSEQLSLQVSLANVDGNAPPLYLIVYNETAHCWEKYSNFSTIPNVASDSRKKRQSLAPLVLEGANTPLGVFAGVASVNDLDCWLQGRSFDSGGSPISGPFISMEHRLDVSGSTFLVRFGTNTGAHASNGVVSNGVCLPVDCNGPYIDAIVESREAFDTASNPLIPVPFPSNTFNITENAPIIFGNLFSFEQHIPATADRRSPFYSSGVDCVTTGSDPNAPGSSFFSFNQGALEFPDASNSSCFLKLQIRDCFLGNDVTVTSINPDTGTIDNSYTETVIETEDFSEMPSVSGTGPTDIVTTPSSGVCDDTTATLRTACLSFICGDTIQLIVRPNIDSGRSTLCEITQRSVFLSNPIISDVNNNMQLILRSGELSSGDYNNPDLGLYFTAGNNAMASGMALERCNAGDGNSTSMFIDLTAGPAVEFSCF